MSKAKVAAGILVMVGIPVAFAVIFAAFIRGYANQHVHHRWAELNGATAIVRERSYMRTLSTARSRSAAAS